MKKLFLLLTFIATLSITSCNTTPNNEMITHTVFFKLKHPKGSEAEKLFIEKAVALKAIPTVLNMTSVKEIGKKNDFEWGLTMQFKNQADYDAYNKHPDHVAFVENVWKKEVVDFMEIDYVDNK